MPNTLPRNKVPTNVTFKTEYILSLNCTLDSNQNMQLLYDKNICKFVRTLT